MSRIGKKPVYLPEGVSVEISGSTVTVKGSKGELARTFPEVITVEQKQDEEKGAYLEVTLAETAESTAIWGTVRSHLANMVQGVHEGWSKSLELNGVGFKMNVAGSTLKMSLGFSHDVDYALPEGITASIEGSILTIAGIDKEVVGQTASEIRALKKPEPYKGKGFRYTDEIIRRKVGKAAKSD